MRDTIVIGKMNSKTKNNSFDFLRLAAAMTVVFSHQFLVLGLPIPKIFNLTDIGSFAVLIFFALSGRLITQSWERDPQVKKFLWKRCLRIFPALILVVTLTVFVVGPIFTNLKVASFFSESETWQYFRCVVLWPGHSWLPGVFEANPYPHSVNAPLWTLPVEFACYLSVLAAGILGVLRRKYLVSICVIILSSLAALASFNSHANIRNVTLMAATFWWGTWLWISFQNSRRVITINLLLGFVALAICLSIGPNSIARTGLILVAGGLVVVASRIQAGSKITFWIGDLSYGVYIIGFPVQQSLVATFGYRSFTFWEFLTMTFLITFPLAWLSWHLVEKHFLRMKNKPDSTRILDNIAESKAI